MKISLWLLGLSVLNFIAVLVAVLLLGQSVPIHFNSNFEVIKMGSPMLLLVIAIIPIMCGVGLFLEIRLRGRNYKNKKQLSVALFSVACLMIYINWMLVGIASSDLVVGNKLSLPIDLFIYVPIGIFMGIVGLLMARKKQIINDEKYKNTEDSFNLIKANKITGKMLMVGGGLIVVGSAMSYFLKLPWLSVVFLGVAFVMFTIMPIAFIKVYYSKSKRKADKQIEELKEFGVDDSETEKQTRNNSENNEVNSTFESDDDETKFFNKK